MSRFDALAYTLETDPEDLANYLTAVIDFSQARRCDPRYGWKYGIRIHRGETHFADIFYGGDNGTDLCHVRHEGQQAPILHSWLQRYISTSGVFYWATRVDACEDWIEEGLFDRMAAEMIRYAKEHNIKISQLGDWVRGKARTLYIGSRQSEVMIRLYEKGYQSGGDPNWVRFETEVKPQGKKERKRQVANMSPDEIMWTGLSGKILDHIGFIHLEKIKLPSVYQPSDAERSRAALLKQYGNIIREWSQEVGGYPELAEVLRSELETT